jgi:hypothetical protein
MRQDALRVVALVGDDGFSLTIAQQFHSSGAVVDLPGGNAGIDWLAILIGQQMDFGPQTFSGTPRSLVRARFLRSVAAC